MSTAIAIFVKTPSLSPLKTRLATGIGKDKAIEFYLLSLKAIAQTVKNIDANPFWAVGEINGLSDPLWSEFKSIHTGDGCLGQRQHHIYSSLLQSNDNVILIGADAPQLSPDIINQAITELKSNDFVIGGARDGGYYLFGGNKDIEQDIWVNTPWSAPTTRECLEAALPSKPAQLQTLTDADTIDDLDHILTEMLQNLSAEQENVAEWVTSLQNNTNDKL